MMMYEPYNEETADSLDKAAFILSEIIDDNAPLNWTKFRAYASYIARNDKLMDELAKLKKGNDD